MKNKFGFNFSYLKGDLFGGITAGIVALPLALAFGVSSGLGPDAGLYGAIFLSFFAALFGGTSTQISGPTAPLTAVSMVVIGGIVAAYDGEVGKALPVIMSVFLLSGLIQVGLGVSGLGKFIRYIPYPVVSGFMTAIGVIIIVTQLLPAVGYYPKEDLEYVETFKLHAEDVIFKNLINEEEKEGIFVFDDIEETVRRAKEISQEQILIESKSLAKSESAGVLGTLKVLPRAFRNINWLELWLTLGTIFIIFGFKRITKKIPSTLIALVVMSGIAYGFELVYRPIERIPDGLPIPHFEIFTTFDFQTIKPYIFTAFALAFLGAIDSLLTSVVADNMTKSKHNPNQELIGQGIGNSLVSLFGGIPGAGATIRTVVNINAGGRTKLSGMISGVLLLIILLAFSGIASKIPAAVLAGILITVGIGVMDYKGLKAIPFMPKSEVVIMLIVMVLSSVWDLVAAVGIGLIIASLMFMRQIGLLTAKRSKISSLSVEKAWSDESDFPKYLKEEVYIKHVSGPLFFGSTSEFNSLINQIPASATTIVIRLDNMHYMDQSGLYAMEDILIGLINSGKIVLFVGIVEQPKYMMERIDIIPDLVPENHLFDSFESCLEWIRENVQDMNPKLPLSDESNPIIKKSK